MSLNINHNPVVDTVIFAFKGYPDEYQNKYCTKEIEKQHLTGELAGAALNNLKQLYEDNKSKDFTYEQFLKNVEDNIEVFNSPDMDPEVKEEVACKLSILAHKRLKFEDARNVNIHQIVNKLGHLVRGRETKGERGMRLASELRSTNSNFELYKSTLKESNPNEISKLKDKTNKLSNTQFKEVVNEIIFDMNRINKFTFCNNLNPEKRKIFDKELLSQDDWYEQTFDLAVCAGEIPSTGPNFYKNFIPEGIVATFQADPENVMKMRKGKILSKDPTDREIPIFNKLYVWICQIAIKDYLDNNTTNVPLKLIPALIKAKDLDLIMQLLTPEDKARLNKLKTQINERL